MQLLHLHIDCDMNQHPELPLEVVLTECVKRIGFSR